MATPIVRGWWVELPDRAEVVAAGRERSPAALAGRAQAELWLHRGRRLDDALAALERGGREARALASALRAEDRIRRGAAAEALPALDQLAKAGGELGGWARLRGAEVAGRAGRLDEARQRIEASDPASEPALLRALVEARLARRAGRIDDADRRLEQAAVDLPRAAAPLAALFHRTRAILASFSGDDGRALMHHRLAIDGFKALGDRFLLAKEYLSLGQVYLDGGEAEVAEFFFQRARELVDGLESERLSGLLASRLGLAALARGDLAAASAHFERDLEAATCAGLRHAAAHARRNVALVRLRTGGRAAGLALLAEARREFRALGDTANAMATELDELSAAAPDSDAEPRLQTIAEFFTDAGRPELAARVQVVRAGRAAASGKTAAALSELEDALRSFRRYRRVDWTVEALTQVADRLAASDKATALELLARGHREALDAGLAGAVPALVERIGRISERAVMALAEADRDELALAPASPGPWYQETLSRSRSAAVRQLLESAREVARTDETVLILGETGTGKEMLARSIHELSRRKEATFVAVNCGAIPDGLLESELFGHARGAFTGAERRRVGILEAADGGCAFLDEIGELSPRGQVTLLRFLEDRRVRPVGANTARTVDVRLLAATNRDLLAEARAGRFRLDLYFRLAVFPITIPPLRERLDDLELLARTLLANLPLAQEKGITALAADALAALALHDWPGNLRELDNVLRAAAIRASGRKLDKRHLALPARAARLEDGRAFPSLEDVEREHLTAALAKTRGNQLRAAALLGIHRNTLAQRMRKFGLEDRG